jgi:hypothetical protein
VPGRGGEVPEWPKGADCKSAAVGLRRFESSPLHQLIDKDWAALTSGRELAGIAQLARARAFQARGRGFESRFPLHAQVAQSVEHVLGKDEVGGSIPLLGLILKFASTIQNTQESNFDGSTQA